MAGQPKTCPWCAEVLKPGNGRHILYFCPQRPPGTLPEVQLRLLGLQRGAPISREETVTLYQGSLWSVPEFQRNWNLSTGQAYWLLRDYCGLVMRDQKEACQQAPRKERTKATNRARYGTDNPSQNSGVKAKKAATFTQHYGVDNIFRTEEFKNRRPGLMMAKYGQLGTGNSKWWLQFWSGLTPSERSERTRTWRAGFVKWHQGLSPEDKAAFVQARLKNWALSYNSSLERRVRDILNQAGAKFQQQFFVGGKSFDFRSGNLLLEVNGDFWHANPTQYCSSDILRFPAKHVTAQELWDRDKTKEVLALGFGYKVAVLWESEMRSMTDEDLWLALQRAGFLP